MLGYGQTDKPSTAADYTLKKLADDLAALLNTVGISKVVRIIHATSSPFTTTMKPNNRVAARLRLAMTGALLS
jgi:pimeloyl-ACP methyl ester carboxylesterase